MPDEDKTGYDLLLEEMKKFNERLDKQDKRIEDVVSFNKSLLDNKGSNNKGETPEEKNARYEKILKEGLQHGK